MTFTVLFIDVHCTFTVHSLHGAQGFAGLTGVARKPAQGAWADAAEAQLKKRWPEPPPRVENGRASQPTAKSLPGFEAAKTAPEDPLAIVEREQAEKKARRAARRLAMQQKSAQES